MTYRGFLAELLMAECDDRNRRRSERRIKAAGFPREKALRTFDFDANSAIAPASIHTLASCDWVRKGLPLCLIGDSGTGRSHLEKNSMAIASNESFSAWTETFTDPRLCAAIVDGPTFGGNIIETGTDSYRLAHSKARLAEI